jgi:hypothetical protein
MLAGEPARDGHLGERGGGDAEEGERRAGRGAIEKSRRAGENRPGDREVGEHEQRDVEDHAERA